MLNFLNLFSFHILSVTLNLQTFVHTKRVGMSLSWILDLQISLLFLVFLSDHPIPSQAEQPCSTKAKIHCFTISSFD